MTTQLLDANNVWLNMVSDVVKYGSTSKPRGMTSKEMIAYRTVTNMRFPIVSFKSRALGYKFQAAEAAWILSGDNRVESIAPYSKDISNFSDDGIRFFGSYGPKIIDQIAYVARALMKDQDSRQAVINIWRENPGPTKDVPCTLSLQFMIRDGRLNCITSMRSSDAWLGWPYDVFNFSMVSLYLLLYLRQVSGNAEYNYLTLGGLYLTAGSQHVYERDMLKVSDCIREPRGPVHRAIEPEILEDESPQGLIDQLWEMANKHGTKVWLK